VCPKFHVMSFHIINWIFKLNLSLAHILYKYRFGALTPKAIFPLICFTSHGCILLLDFSFLWFPRRKTVAPQSQQKTAEEQTRRNTFASSIIHIDFHSMHWLHFGEEDKATFSEQVCQIFLSTTYQIGKKI
jgi:hypothetical protein